VESLRNGQKVMGQVSYNYFPADDERYYTSNSMGQPCNGMNDCGPGYHKEKVGEGTSRANGWTIDICDCVPDVIDPIDNGLSDEDGGGGDGFGEGEIYGLPKLGPPARPGPGTGDGSYNGPGYNPGTGGDSSDSGSGPGSGHPGGDNNGGDSGGPADEQDDCINQGNCDATSPVMKIKEPEEDPRCEEIQSIIKEEDENGDKVDTDFKEKMVNKAANASEATDESYVALYSDGTLKQGEGEPGNGGFTNPTKKV